MLSLKLLWRNLRTPETRILGLACALAVTMVCAIALFAERLEGAMVRSANSFLAADRAIRSSKALPDAWLQAAGAAQLRTARTVSFSSMLYAGDRVHLASVKAVSAAYPLLGQLEVRRQLQAGEPEKLTHGPAPGEVWLEPRLFNLLAIAPGDVIELGDARLRATRVLVAEPDRSQGFTDLGGRALMHYDDLAATAVLQPGSRADYRLLLAGPEQIIDQVIARFDPPLSVHDREVKLAQAQGRVAGNLQRARQFLTLASLFGVLLSGVAMAIAAQRFCVRHIDQVALLKSFGISAARLRWLYLSQLFWLAGLASLVGLSLGYGLHGLLTDAIARLLGASLPAAGPLPAVLAVITGYFCLLFFTLPPLWPLQKVAPVKVIRREMPVPSTPGGLQLLLALCLALIFMWAFTGDLLMSGLVSVGVALVAATAAALAWLVLRAAQSFAGRVGGRWRLVLATLKSRSAEAVLQLAVISSALLLLGSLLLMRTSLLSEWRSQLPAQAPNVFVVNLSEAELPAFESYLQRLGLQHAGLYPLVRGRVTAVKGQPVSQMGDDRPEALRRELNLSWSAGLPAGNSLVQGHWWPEAEPAAPGQLRISVEQGLARDLALAPGDVLEFSLGGLPLTARIASVRSLQWGSLQPNFYVLFEPGALADFAPMFMTSLYSAPDQGQFVSGLVKAHPTAIVIDMERVFKQVRQVVDQVSGAVQLVFWMVLLAALLVVLAAVYASMDQRGQELGLLRSLGAGPRLLRASLVLEFALVGALAGLLAAAGSEALLWSLQAWVFKMQWQPHFWLWLLSPLAGALLVAGLGLWACRPLLRLTPADLLRSAA